jgi:O-antigen ligase
MAGNHRIQALQGSWIVRLGLLLLLCIGIGLYAIYAQAVDNYRLFVLLLALPISIGVLVLPAAPRILMTLLVLSLSFSARFRFLGGGEFYAGAEAAIAPLDLPLFGLALLWLADTCISGSRLKFKLGRTGKAFLIVLGVYILSLVPAYDRGLTMLAVARMLKMGLLVLVVRHYVRSERDVIFIVKLLLIGIILQGGLAILQTVLHSTLGLGFLGERDTFWVVSSGSISIGRSGGTLGHANALANYLEVLIPLALALLIARIRGPLRILSLAALPLGMIGLFLTFSRAGWGASLVGIGAVLLMMGVFGGIRRSKVIFIALLALACLGIIALLLWGTISQRIDAFGSNSWLVRTGTIQIAVKMIGQNPLLGVGGNNYLMVAPQYVPSGTSQIFGDLIAHNLFFLVAAETGLIGLFAFSILMLAIALTGRKVAMAQYQLLSAVAVGTLGGILALVVHGMFDWLFFYDPIYTLFWFQVGLLLAMRDIWSRATGT